MGYTLILVSLLNALFVYSRTKKYSLVNRPIEKIPDTPSAHKVLYEESYDPSPDDDAAANTQSPVKKIMNSLFFSTATDSNADSVSPTYTISDSSSSGPRIWVLDIWDPPLFNLYLMSVYSPLSVLTLWYGPLSFFTIILFWPLLSYYLYTQTRMWLVLQKDKTILHAEVLGEYEQSVVRPIVSAARRDVCVGTDGSVTYYAAGLNHQFKVHQSVPSALFQQSRAGAGAGTGTSSSSAFNSPLKNSNINPLDSQPPHHILGSPVFPSTLAAANSVRERNALPPFKLTYNPAGYYTGTPNGNNAQRGSSSSSSFPSSVSPAGSNGTNNITNDYQNSPLSRKSESSLFRRLHK